MRPVEYTGTKAGKQRAVPLELKYEYHPETPWAPIHEVTTDRIDRIKQHYWHLWDLGTADELASLPTDPAAVFAGSEAVITEADVRAFVKVVGNDSEAYGPLAKTGAVPMDYAIRMGWKAIMKPLFPSTVPGDLLKLVHLSNAFKLRDGVAPLKVSLSPRSSRRQG